MPLAGGLVGYAAYDVVRYFERLPRAPRRASALPALHYVAPRSLLVFDHLTRGIALVHAGTRGGAPRAAPRSGPRAARRHCRNAPARRRVTRRRLQPSPRAEYMAGVKRTQEYIAAGDVYQLVLASRFVGPP